MGFRAPEGCHAAVQTDPRVLGHPGLWDPWSYWNHRSDRSQGCCASGAAGSQIQPEPATARPPGQSEPGAPGHPQLSNPWSCWIPGQPDCWGLPGLWSFQTTVTADPQCYRIAGHPHPGATGLPGVPRLPGATGSPGSLEARTPHPPISPRGPSPSSAALPTWWSPSGPHDLQDRG